MKVESVVYKRQSARVAKGQNQLRHDRTRIPVRAGLARQLASRLKQVKSGDAVLI